MPDVFWLSSYFLKVQTPDLINSQKLSCNISVRDFVTTEPRPLARTVRFASRMDLTTHAKAYSSYVFNSFDTVFSFRNQSESPFPLNHSVHFFEFFLLSCAVCAKPSRPGGKDIFARCATRKKNKSGLDVLGENDFLTDSRRRHQKD